MSARTTSEPGTMAVVRAWAGVGLLGLGLVLVVGAVRAESQTTTRVSVASDGSQASVAGYSRAAVSGDGRFIAFPSFAATLVPDDTNLSEDVFVHDRQTGSTTRISVATGGAQGNGASSYPSISADGRFVAFESLASTLVPGDTNGAGDVFVHDRVTGTTTRVSVAADGSQGNGASTGAAISADGQSIAFSSSASNLVPGDTNATFDVFVRDTTMAVTTRVSVATDGSQALGSSGWASISADGRFVLFDSFAVNLVPLALPYPTLMNGVFLRDRQTGTTSRVAAFGTGSGQASLSADGRYVAFATSVGFVPDDTNGHTDIFVLDLETKTIVRASVASDGTQANSFSSSPSVSADGRVIAFVSNASNLVSGDTNGTSDVFAHDVLTGVTTRVSVVSDGTQAASGSRSPAVSADGRAIVFFSMAPNLVPNDTNLAEDAFVHDLDADGDGLLAPWETAFGLDPLVSTGDNGADGDPDGDGRTNTQEQADATHPRGFYTRYLAEGATSNFFDTRLALLNPGGLTTVLLRFQKGDGTSAARVVALNGVARATVDAKSVAGLAAAEFSTIIESDGPVVVDRQMTWDASGYGAHAETALTAPSTTWYLAEGATHSNFSLFYLVQNPHATAVPVTVTYLLPAPGAPLTKVYTVPAESRFNIWVDNEGSTDPNLSALAATNVSAVITAPQPILVERAMYLTQPGGDGLWGTPDDIRFSAGHESAGVTTPALSWFLAEGATGPYFDEFILIANPGPSAAEVEARYLLVDGTVLTRTYPVPAQSRYNIWVNEEEFPGLGKALAEQALSATLTSTNGVPIIVERAMWWPRPAPTWMEAHNSAGVTSTGTLWGLAEGEAGGPRAMETYVLVANTSPFAGTARVTLVFDHGGTQSVDVPLAASSRTNVPVIESWFPGSTGQRFGVLVESLGGTPAQIVVERAMYSDANGIHWAAGTNATATRLVP